MQRQGDEEPHPPHAPFPLTTLPRRPMQPLGTGLGARIPVGERRLVRAFVDGHGTWRLAWAEGTGSGASRSSRVPLYGETALRVSCGPRRNGIARREAKGDVRNRFARAPPDKAPDRLRPPTRGNNFHGCHRGPAPFHARSRPDSASAGRGHADPNRPSRFLPDHSPHPVPLPARGATREGAPARDGLAARASSRLSAYYELTKPGIAAYVMITAGVSYFVAAGGAPALLPVLHVLVGTVTATGGALALNQYLEREVDGRMNRTRSRPLPSGRLEPVEALGFGAGLVIAGCLYLWGFVGWLPAALTLFSALAYNFVYTPLKPRSYMATLAGAIPGAVPALIGWSAATGSLALGAMVLFAIAFLWQLPHVLALAWLLREDYARAGFLLTPPASPGGVVIARQMNLYTLTLVPVSLLPTLLQLTGWIYFAGALVLGLVLLYWTVRAGLTMERDPVRRVFLGSLAYQPLLLGLMLIDVVPGA